MKPLPAQTLERFRDLVARQLGLYFEHDKREVLAEALHSRLAAHGQAEAEVYLARLAGPAGPDELRLLAARLTVGETYFFRQSDHFRVLEELVVPEILGAPDDKAAPGRLRVLSAGCATGEEAYSLAILMDRLRDRLAGWEVSIAAIDLNPDAIAHARKGLYSEWALRETAEETRARYFRKTGRSYELDPAIRAKVSFEERNLVDPDPAFWKPGAFDVVFCRNVTMYLEPLVTRAVVARIAASLAPRGHLFMGYAETLRGISTDFHLCHTHETFYYRRRGEDEAPPRRRAAGLDAPRAAAEPWMPAPDDSWVESIRQSARRIATLSASPSKAASAALPQPAEAPRPDPSRPGRPAGQEARRPRAEQPEAGSGTAAGGGAMNQVLELLRRERFQEARQALEALPEAARNDPDALLLLGVLLANAGRVEEAGRIGRQLLDADELNAGAHYLMALCREGAGELAAAAEHDRTAAYLDAAFAMPHFHLGLLAQRAGDRDAAQREFETALALFAREDAARILLFGGGFSREALEALCRARLGAEGGALSPAGK